MKITENSIDLKKRLKVLTLRFKKMILLNLSPRPDKNYLNIQKKAEEIISSLIDNSKTEIYIMNDIFYLKNRNILARFDHENAHITNGSYSYYISIGQYVSQKMRNKYKTKLHDIILKFDTNNDINTINNLNKILENI